MSAMKRIGAVLLSIFVVILLIFLERLVPGESKKDPAAQINPMEKDQYNEFGLPQGRELISEPFYQNENLVIYEDRAFRHFKFDINHVANVKLISKKIEEQLPSNTKLFVFPIPPRVVLEEGYEEDSKRYQLYLKAMKNYLPKSVRLVDTLPILNEHEMENIFFRTEDAWTARGAYYGTAELCENIGIIPIALEEYDEYMFKRFTGTVKREASALFDKSTENKAKTRNIPKDPLYYYILPGSENFLEIFRHELGKVISEKRQVIRKSGNGTSAFVGGDYEWGIVVGDRKSESREDSTLLLLCDSSGQMLAPYLANYYDSVIVINIRRYSNLEKQLEHILSSHSITEVVYAQNADEMGIPGRSKAFMSMLEGESK